MRVLPALVLLAACSVSERPTGPAPDLSAPPATPAPIDDPAQPAPSDQGDPDLPTLPVDPGGAGLAAYELPLVSDAGVIADGVAISGIGDMAHAGLGSVSCDIYTTYGSIGSDYYDAGDDTVVDVGIVGVGEAWLAITPGLVNVHPVGSGQTSQSYSVAGVTDARFTEDGFVAVARTTTGCLAGWFDDAGNVLGTVHFEAGLCDGSFAADPVTGLAWLASDRGVIELAPGDTRVVHPGVGAHLAYDGDALYVGEVDGHLSSLASDGAVRWSVDMGAPIQALAADPANGALFAAVDSFQRQVHMLDAADATELGAFSYSLPAKHLAVSAGGTRLALATTSDVRFHDIIEN
ncbi:MAG: hypothetical protein H6737_07440 [Alphaproteobacteria bacterium]|nr:hypothetical protein [Alphaproteobacteria bacterium]